MPFSLFHTLIVPHRKACFNWKNTEKSTVSGLFENFFEKIHKNLLTYAIRMIKIRIVKGHNPMAQLNIIRSTEEKEQ